MASFLKLHESTGQLGKVPSPGHGPTGPTTVIKSSIYANGPPGLLGNCRGSRAHLAHTLRYCRQGCWCQGTHPTRSGELTLSTLAGRSHWRQVVPDPLPRSWCSLNTGGAARACPDSQPLCRRSSSTRSASIHGPCRRPRTPSARGCGRGQNRQNRHPHRAGSSLLT